MCTSRKSSTTPRSCRTCAARRRPARPPSASGLCLLHFRREEEIGGEELAEGRLVACIEADLADLHVVAIGHGLPRDPCRMRGMTRCGEDPAHERARVVVEDQVLLRELLLGAPVLRLDLVEVSLPLRGVDARGRMRPEFLPVREG